MNHVVDEKTATKENLATCAQVMWVALTDRTEWATLAHLRGVESLQRILVNSLLILEAKGIIEVEI